MEGSVIPTRYWHRLEDGRIQCDVCPRACKLHEGQRGMCFVRARQQDQIVLTTYGRSSGFCVDPIEKKPLDHFLPGTPVLSFGTAGCNLACRFCQNWDISKAREIDILADQASPETVARVAQRLGCRSVAFTYNDPAIFHEYAIDVAKACREKGLKAVAVTAGYVCPEPRVEF
ncbi:MAG: AmmeMemoRadiSam system radical SAM enzyme, partial [Dehalococcoidia bacterium]